MSIRQSLLAILDEGPSYGARLRTEFERRTGATWPLNVGQVYQTLTRLERDGLVAALPEDEAGHVRYEITAAGHAEVTDWFASPVPREAPQRDELAIKIAMAVTVPGIDVQALLQRQRGATMGYLQDCMRLVDRRSDEPDDLPWLLVLDSLVFAAEAEIRWLDHVETRVARAAGQRLRRAQATVETLSRQAVR